MRSSCIELQAVLQPVAQLQHPFRGATATCNCNRSATAQREFSPGQQEELLSLQFNKVIEMKVKLQLRDYQAAALESIKDHIARGMRRLLVALPTGTGKTVVFSHLPGWLGLKGRWLVLAHREELLDQALRKFQTVNPELTCAVEQADRRAGDAQVVIASVPTLQRTRLAALNPGEFAGVIVDEAHHSVADSYHRIFDHFGLFDESNDKPLIGFTATPKRGDDIGLSAVFEAIAYEATLRDMIKAGYLSDISGIRINTGVSLSDVQVRCGEFVHNQLAAAVDTDERNALIVRSYHEYADGRRALAFCVGVDHAVRLAETFKAAGIRAASVSGETPKDERRNILERFSAGELDLVTNCGVLTEGFDEPRVDCILMARPTKSSLLYTQIIGRGTRLHPDKSDCLVLDFVDASTKHSVHSVASLFGLPPSLNLAGKKALETKEQLELTEEKYPWIDLSQLRHVDDLKLVATKIEFFNAKVPTEIERFTNYQWMRQMDGGYRLSLPKRETMEVLPTRLDTWLIRFTDEKHEVFNLPEHRELSEAIKAADFLVRQLRNDATKLVDRRARWRQQPASEKQIKCLRKMRMEFPEQINKGQAAAILTLAFQQKNNQSQRRCVNG